MHDTGEASDANVSYFMPAVERLRDIIECIMSWTEEKIEKMMMHRL